MSDTQISPSECWFCDETLRDQPAGGWLYEDQWWRVGHVPASCAIAGTVVLESRRHVADQTDMTEDEAATLVG